MNLAEPHHRLQVEATLGALRLHADLEFSAPWTVIFGPSGSGKSSLLRAMCGLLTTAQVEFAERAPAPPPETSAWTEIDGPHRRTPPHRRNLAYAPQGAPIFPHLTVREHVAFALRNSPHQRNSHPTNVTIIDAALDLFALTALASRRPRDLSGGERQRLNLARAFAVPHPRLMLLDEPFTGIDRATRDTLLPLMRDRLAAAAIPAISVTHDVEEALLLNAEVIRLESGRILVQGPARHVLSPERDQMLRALTDGE